MNQIEKTNIERTKKGHPALWESGGGYRNTGFATIVANPDGTAKIPVYIRKRGTLSCSDHALFIVSVGDIIVKADHHRYDFVIDVYRIAAINGDEADIVPIHTFYEGEWDVEPPEDIADAVEAAKNKASHYHCRTPYYYKEKGVS